MHKIRSMLLTGILACGLLAAGHVQAFDEGIDYQLLSDPQPTETGDKIEVLELFWYGCPHCYHLEPELAEWLEYKRDDVAFRRMPAVLGASWAYLARAFYAAQVLGVQERIHMPLFRALHDERMPLGNENALTEWMATQRVDKEEFRKAFRSFVVDMKVRRTAQMSRRYGISGVPAVVVNGKYVTSPSMAAGSERMFRVIDYLIGIEAGEIPQADEDTAETAPATTREEPQAAAADSEPEQPAAPPTAE